MADEADRANDLRDSELDSLIAGRPRPVAITASPTCLFCGDDLRHTQDAAPRRWCDADCRDEWQRRNPAPAVRLRSDAHGFQQLRPGLSIDEQATAANALIHSGCALDDGDDD